MNQDMHGLYKVEFLVAPGEGNRSVRSYLTGVRHLSGKAVTRLKNQGTVLVNSVPVRLTELVQEGDRVVIAYPPEKINPYLFPEEVPINIVYEDTDILVLDKQAGVCVHPTKKYPRGTLANGVLFHWEKKGEICAPHFVNRLDKNTSGLVLIAKSTYAAQQFFRQQSEGLIRRLYLALVHGEVHEDCGCIDLPIAREDNPTTKRMISKEGQPSLTYYRVVGRYQGYTLLELRLETGRTHQIRVHLSHLGHPIVGDSLYGGKTTYLERQFLHAFQLALYHPVSQRKMSFSIVLPDDLKAVLSEIAKN